MSEYYADVKRYDAGADEGKIDAIVKHLGIALRGRDSSLVSCSDQSELDRVRDKWCMKKLGQTDKDACENAIGAVCEMMKDDRSKSRVTFYYLTAKEMDALGEL